MLGDTAGESLEERRKWEGKKRRDGVGGSREERECGWVFWAV